MGISVSVPSFIEGANLMGIRHLKTQLFVALSFALLASCSSDSGVISKKDGNQQISSSPDSPIQRLAVDDSISSEQHNGAGEQQAAVTEASSNDPLALDAPGEAASPEASAPLTTEAEPSFS